MTRVLVVDDNHDAADSLAMLVAFWGHEVRKAYDAESVLQQALAFDPHVLLLDIGLPRRDGFAVASRLRQFRYLANLKIAAVTGLPAVRIEEHPEARIERHFSKPIDHDLLQEYLDSFPCEEWKPISFPSSAARSQAVLGWEQ